MFNKFYEKEGIIHEKTPPYSLYSIEQSREKAEVERKFLVLKGDVIYNNIIVKTKNVEFLNVSFNIFKGKYNLDGSIEKYKARLTTRRFTQTKMLTTSMSIYKLVIHQMDIKLLSWKINGDDFSLNEVDKYMYTKLMNGNYVIIYLYVYLKPSHFLHLRYGKIEDIQLTHINMPISLKYYEHLIKFSKLDITYVIDYSDAHKFTKS
ncbi:hypothetical protein CR513_47980, partial [Mucuna pruriens]